MAGKDRIKEDGRVWEMSRIEVTTLYKAPAYVIEAKTEAVLGPTGAWNFLSIRHESGWPVYKARWDEKPSELDIDMFVGGSTKPIKTFEGHHTSRSTGDFRQYEVRIREEEVDIFTGLVSFSITRRVLMNAEVVGFTGEAGVTYSPKRSTGGNEK